MLSEPAPPEAPRIPASRRRFPLGFDTLFPCLYGLTYAFLVVLLHLRFFPIGDIDLETDFYADLVIAARKLAAGDASVHDFAWKGPVYAFLLVPIQAIVGDWYRGAAVLSGVSAGASLLIVYRLVLRLFDRRTAVATTIATSLVVEFFVQSHRATTDVLFLALALGSMACTLLARGSMRRHAAAGGLAGLAFLTRYNGAFLVAGTLLFLMLLNPDRVGWRDRAKTVATYAVLFLLATVPWFLANALETGRPLATRNPENVIAALFDSPQWQTDVAEQDGTLRVLVAKHPMHVLTRFGRNLITHMEKNLKQLLGWPMVLLPLIGILGLVIRPPTRRQAGLYLFAVVYWLCMGIVFYAPRFFLPMVPAYLAIGFAFGRRGDGASARLGILSRRLMPAWRRTATVGFFVALLWILVVVQVPRIVAAERKIHARRPLYVLEAARYLAEREAPRSARIMARKGHIAYHAGFEFSGYSTEVASLEDLVRRARSSGAEYIAYSEIEYSLLPRMLFLAVSDTVPFLNEVYRGDGIRVFGVEPGAEPLLSEAERYELLLANLRAARTQRRPVAIYTALMDLGDKDMAQLAFERAAARFREAVEVAERGDGRAMEWRSAEARHRLATADLELGSARSAIVHLERNMEYYASLGAARDLARTEALLRRAHAVLDRE